LHRKLSQYFGQPEVISLRRKIEEYPYHLEQIGDLRGLSDCLLTITEFALLYTDRYKSDLFHYWSVVGAPIEDIALQYSQSLNQYVGSNPAGDVLGA